jgi:hypothetical protein
MTKRIMENSFSNDFNVCEYLADTFIVTFFGPFDRRVIHFVNDDNQSFYSSSFGQHGMFSGLPTFFKTRLKFTSSR